MPWVLTMVSSTWRTCTFFQRTKSGAEQREQNPWENTAVVSSLTLPSSVIFPCKNEPSKWCSQNTENLLCWVSRWFIWAWCVAFKSPSVPLLRASVLWGNHETQVTFICAAEKYRVARYLKENLSYFVICKQINCTVKNSSIRTENLRKKDFR